MVVAGVVALVVLSRNEARTRLVLQMLQGVANCGVGDLHHNLKELSSLDRDLNQGPHNRIVLVEAGTIPVLANFVFSPENLAKDANACEQALEILVLLPLQDIRKLVDIGTKQFTAISWFLNRGSIDGRVNTALLLGNLTQKDTEMKASMGNTSGILEGLVQLLKEDLYLKAFTAGLNAIISNVSNGPERNMSKAGVVFAVVDRLLKSLQRAQRSPQLHYASRLNPD